MRLSNDKTLLREGATQGSFLAAVAAASPTPRGCIYRAPWMSHLAESPLCLIYDTPDQPPPPHSPPTPPHPSYYFPSETSRHTPSCRLTQFQLCLSEKCLLCSFSSFDRRTCRGEVSCEADRLALAWPCLGAADWRVTVDLPLTQQKKEVLSESVVWGGGETRRDGGGEELEGQ